MKSAIQFAFILSINSQFLHGQDESSFQNSQIVEVGGLYGQLMWRVRAAQPFQQASEFNRTQFMITPTARITLLFVAGSQFFISPFIGYSRLGGKSEKMRDGYEDEFMIDALQPGSFFGFRYNTLDIALGIELNYHFEKQHRSFTSVGPGSFQWVERQEQVFLKDLSADVGLRFAGNFDHFLVAGEAWFGVSPMEKSEWSHVVSIRQNNFKVLVGYRMF